MFFIPFTWGCKHRVPVCSRGTLKIPQHFCKCIVSSFPARILSSILRFSRYMPPQWITASGTQRSFRTTEVCNYDDSSFYSFSQASMLNLWLLSFSFNAFFFKNTSSVSPCDLFRVSRENINNSTFSARIWIKQYTFIFSCYCPAECHILTAAICVCLALHDDIIWAVRKHSPGNLQFDK